MDEHPLKGYSSFLLDFLKCPYSGVDNLWHFFTRDTEKCPLSVLTDVRIKRVDLSENVWAFVGTNESVLNIRVSVLSGCP